jgi:hypothetical protein
MSLTTLDELTSLVSVSGLYLRNLSQLDDLSVLTGLTLTRELVVRNCDALQSLDQLTVGSSLSRSLELRDNGALDDLSALSGLTSVGGHLYVINNGALMSLADLSQLGSVGGSSDGLIDGLSISNNTLLSCLGLSSLSSLGGIGPLVILDNTQVATSEATGLRDLLVTNGFTGTTTVTGNLGATVCP